MDRPPEKTTELERIFDQAVERHHLLAPGDAVLVGVSGGADSTALLHLISSRAGRLNLRIGIGHLDHQLRQESGRDAEAVARMGAELGVPVHLERVDVPALRRRLRTSVETAAREARYDFFRRTAAVGGYGKVALGHHADDNAETLLMNLLRGSGRLGLGGIRPLRDGMFVRPLLRAFRSDIEHYLHRHGLSWASDATNADLRLRRNRIRADLIPLLEREYQPAVRAALSRAAEVLAAEEVWIEELLQPLLARTVHEPARGRVVVEIQELEKLPPAAQRRIVRAALRRTAGELGRIGFEHIDRILGAGAGRLPGGPVHLPGGPVHLPGGLRVSRTSALIVIERVASAGRPRPARAVPDYEYRLTACGTVFIRETGEAIRIAECAAADVRAPGHDPWTARFDADALEFPVVVRNRRPGDRFRPLGAGGSQKLKKFFGDHKVTAGERVRCPLVLSGGNIVWVAGHRVDERARLQPGTRRVLTAERIIAPFGAASIALPGTDSVAPPEGSD